jgi:hypothetical protein
VVQQKLSKIMIEPQLLGPNGTRAAPDVVVVQGARLTSLSSCDFRPARDSTATGGNGIMNGFAFFTASRAS